MSIDPRPHRPIRSYVRRDSRITSAQQRALEELWPRYGIDVTDRMLDLEHVFGRRAPVILEIGFGNGATLAELAERRPEHDFLGVEVHRPGVGRLLRTLAARGINNVRVIMADAVEVLARSIPDASFAAVHVFFPDPWPKKRHHKRRLVRVPFAELIARKLEAGGMFHMATDWPDYAEDILAVMSNLPQFENAAGAQRYAERPPWRPLTKFEERGHKLGHEVRDLLFRRVG